jgi:hypothetical protein
MIVRLYHNLRDRLLRMFPEGHLRVLLNGRLWLWPRSIALSCRKPPSAVPATVRPASEKGPDLIPNTTAPEPLHSLAVALGTMHS